MQHHATVDLDRRRFLVRSVPACAVTCLALEAGSRATAAQAPPAPQAASPKHPFDEENPRKPTFRQQMQQGLVGSRHLALMQFLTRTLGRDKTREMLESFAAEDALGHAEAAVKRLGGNTFAHLVRVFSPANYRGLCVMKVVESTEKVHQLEVTECLWATVCREANAADEGYASICHGDFAFARAFNPRITMVRDRTLMQGHQSCNHRYVLSA